MASFRGERFDIDISSDDEHDERALRDASAPAFDMKQPSPTIPILVKDIQEKPLRGTRPPVAPTGDRTQYGFPTHKKRVGTSRFKLARGEATKNENITSGQRFEEPSVPQKDMPQDMFREERRKIDEENKQRLARMSDEEIEQERRELMQGLPSSLIERLLRRANIDDPLPTDYPIAGDADANLSSGPQDSFQDQKLGADDQRGLHSTTDTSPEQSGEGSDPNKISHHQVEPNSIEEDPDQHPPTTDSEPNLSPPIHFPRPPNQTAPALDPSSPSFLTDLHSKYFPDLPTDPSKLAWMTESDTTVDNSWSSYSPSVDSVPVSALRFSFTGALLPPTVSASIPITKGLHHHGDSPASAGYTIGELAHLARSSFPSQRCLAFQTLGRLLYRLGIGEFGRGEEGESVERGLWGCIRSGRVLETLQEEANRSGGHASSKAYAVDALWLWRKGGGGTGGVTAQ